MFLRYRYQLPATGRYTRAPNNNPYRLVLLDDECNGLALQPCSLASNTGKLSRQYTGWQFLVCRHSVFVLLCKSGELVLNYGLNAHAAEKEISRYSTLRL
jgi:hypothetical protein